MYIYKYYGSYQSWHFNSLCLEYAFGKYLCIREKKKFKSEVKFKECLLIKNRTSTLSPVSISHVEYGNVKDLILITIDWFLCIIYDMHISCLYCVCLSSMESFACFSVTWPNIWPCTPTTVSSSATCAERRSKPNPANWNTSETSTRIRAHFRATSARNASTPITRSKDTSARMKTTWKWCQLPPTF